MLALRDPSLCLYFTFIIESISNRESFWKVQKNFFLKEVESMEEIGGSI